ncbi:MAG: 3-phosphoshikimate 1-carboxyvinyltransferase [Bacillota bacterium]
MEITIRPAEKIEGRTRMPGDTDIALGALLLSSLSEGTVEIEGIPETEDTRSTLNCLKGLGGEFEEIGLKIKVKGKGLRGLKEPDDVLDAGKSDTTARLLTGLLAGQPFHSTLTGEKSLKKYSMKNVTEPLMQMGASISGRHNGEHLPLAIRGYDLLPINYTLPVACSQLKSALLTAALYSRGVTEITDLYHTRDHTERALRHLGVRIEKLGRHYINLKGPVQLKGERFYIPGDISRAAFFIVASTLAPRGELYLEDVGINPSRAGIIEVLGRMGAEIRLENRREYNNEPLADLVVKGGRKLKGTEIAGSMMHRLIDEIPALAVAALFAEGDTILKGVNTLQTEKSERLRLLSLELRKMGALVEELDDRLVIRGNSKLSGARCESHSDHAVAMALATAALFAEDESVIYGAEAAQSSFPGFFDVMNRIAS